VIAAGEHRLRALEPEDVALLYDWENRSEEWWLGAQLAPVSRAALERFALGDHDVFREGQIRLMLSHGPDTVAALDLYDVNFRHRRAGVGVVVAAHRREEGHGRVGLELLSAYALQHLGLHQIYAEIPADHSPSLALFEAAGFTPFATLPDWIRVGEGWRDVVVMRQFSMNAFQGTA
jgi:diamine N-acetyltransferase